MLSDGHGILAQQQLAEVLRRAVDGEGPNPETGFAPAVEIRIRLHLDQELVARAGVGLDVGYLHRSLKLQAQ